MTASVMDAMRAAGWNVHLVATSSHVCFAGLLQSSRGSEASKCLTFRDVRNELRLCFDIPTEDGPWNNLGFAYEGLLDSASRVENGGEDSSESINNPQLVSHDGLDQPLCGPPLAWSPESEYRPAVRYRLVQHRRPCRSSADKPLAFHIKAGCTNHIAHPVPRREPRYLPPKKSTTDPRVSYMPFRKRLRTRSSQSSSKRS